MKYQSFYSFYPSHYSPYQRIKQSAQLYSVTGTISSSHQLDAIQEDKHNKLMPYSSHNVIIKLCSFTYKPMSQHTQTR